MWRQRPSCVPEGDWTVVELSGWVDSVFCLASKETCWPDVIVCLDWQANSGHSAERSLVLPHGVLLSGGSAQYLNKQQPSAWRPYGHGSWIDDAVEVSKFLQSNCVVFGQCAVSRLQHANQRTSCHRDHGKSFIVAYKAFHRETSCAGTSYSFMMAISVLSSALWADVLCTVWQMLPTVCIEQTVQARQCCNSSEALTQEIQGMCLRHHYVWATQTIFLAEPSVP